MRLFFGRSTPSRPRPAGEDLDEEETTRVSKDAPHRYHRSILAWTRRGRSLDAVSKFRSDFRTAGFCCKCFVLKWWPGTESNRRRQPFQGCALPAELPGRVKSQFTNPNAVPATHPLISLRRAVGYRRTLRRLYGGTERAPFPHPRLPLISPKRRIGIPARAPSTGAADGSDHPRYTAAAAQ